ncbi:MAG: ribonuclease HII [bacterium]|nr:ribonuclease HII [bacterium]
MKKSAENKCEIGIDEAGRGPLAGPVSVGAFIFLKKSAKKLFNGVKESKQLREEKREEWFLKIDKAKKAGLVDFSVKLISNKIIDDKGLSFAIKKGLSGALSSVVGKNEKKKDKKDKKDFFVLLDGGLKAPADYLNQKTIIKGDEKIQVIALASICAKVLRDRYMRKISLKFPEYKFDIHKGYGTKGHYDAIKKFGILDIHRKSFLKNILK